MNKEKIEELEEVEELRGEYKRMKGMEKEIKEGNEEMIKLSGERGKLEEIEKCKKEKRIVKKIVNEEIRRLDGFIRINDKIRVSHKDIYERYIIPTIDK
jgi:hypothetical protein